MRASIGVAVVLLATAQSPAPRTSKVWVGQTDRIEEALRTAEVVRFEPIATGVTHPRRAYVQPGGMIESFVWKTISPAYIRGYWESYRSEIAAYELDKLLALDMVPPAVEREIDGKRGAAVMWVPQTTSVRELGGTIPTDRVASEDIRKMQLFDNFIGNADRNAGNILIDPANNIVLIDHSRAFVERRELPQKFERVDAGLWTAIQALAVDLLRARLAPLVGNRAVDAMIARRDRLRRAIDQLVKKSGRSRVIIPSEPNRSGGAPPPQVQY
jgi:hypothetical protein